MPIDPVGGGTWIAVNQSRVALCLLNNYQSGVGTIETWHSRGELIKNLISLKSSRTILAQIQKINLSRYQPFSLCVFSPALSISNPEVPIICWDGQHIHIVLAEQPIVSSVKSLEEVIQYRKNTFKNIISDDRNNREKHFLYHASHEPKKSKYSVCMHRDDAVTHSFSHIIVSNDIIFRYQDASPCNDCKWKELIF